MKSRRLSLLAAGVVLAGALSNTGASAIEIPPIDIPLPELSLEEVEQLVGVEVPDGVGVVLFTHFPVDNPLVIDDVPYLSLTLDVGSSPEEGVTTRNATPAGEEGGDAAPECSDDAYTRVGKQWNEVDLPVKFAFNKNSAPDYLSPWMTTRSLREAHHVWAETNSKCNDSDAIDFSFSYTGYTTKRIGYDQVNAIDFGKLDHPVAVSYVWYTDQRIREVDLRFNNKYSWTNRPGDNRYNIKNVAVHEIGHHLGLDDLNNAHGSLTMYGFIAKGELRKTTLGRGDVRGAQVLTP